MTTELAGAHYFEDWTIGKVYETASRKITQEIVDHFNEVEAHKSPLHNDPAFVSQTIWDRLTMHGLLPIVMASGMMGDMNLFEGSAIAFLGMSWKFKEPVFVDDTLRVRWWIREKRPTSKPGRGVIVRQVEVLNQDNLVVGTGEMTSLWKFRSVDSKT